MANDFLRVWKKFSLKEIKQSLLIIGDLAADCAACRELGLSYEKTKTCPQCGVEFRFVTSRPASGNSSDRFRWVRRLSEKRPDLTFIEYDDFKKSTGRSQARQILGGD